MLSICIWPLFASLVWLVSEEHRGLVRWTAPLEGLKAKEEKSDGSAYIISSCFCISLDLIVLEISVEICHWEKVSQNIIDKGGEKVCQTVKLAYLGVVVENHVLHHVVAADESWRRVANVLRKRKSFVHYLVEVGGVVRAIWAIWSIWVIIPPLLVWHLVFELGCEDISEVS